VSIAGQALLLKDWQRIEKIASLAAPVLLLLIVVGVHVKMQACEDLLEVSQSVYKTLLRKSPAWNGTKSEEEFVVSMDGQHVLQSRRLTLKKQLHQSDRLFRSSSQTESDYVQVTSMAKRLQTTMTFGLSLYLASKVLSDRHGKPVVFCYCREFTLESSGVNAV
jgi:hypothetical protein